MGLLVGTEIVLIDFFKGVYVRQVIAYITTRDGGVTPFAGSTSYPHYPHPDWAGPSESSMVTYPRSTLLNYSDRTGTSAFKAIKRLAGAGSRKN